MPGQAGIIKFYAPVALVLCLSGCANGPRFGSGDTKSQYAQLYQQNQRLAAANSQTAASTQQLQKALTVANERLDNLELERSQLQQRYMGLLDRQRGQPSPLSAEATARFQKLHERFPQFEFDAATGVSRFADDILFASGSSEVREPGKTVLQELAAIMNDKDSRSLGIFVVGHTDDRPINNQQIRTQHPTNWNLSTDRAAAVVVSLAHNGINETRMGAAGYSMFQPVSDNKNEASRKKNRRVEIYLLAPDAQVAGWNRNGPQASNSRTKNPSEYTFLPSPTSGGSSSKGGSSAISFVSGVQPLALPQTAETALFTSSPEPLSIGGVTLAAGQQSGTSSDQSGSDSGAPSSIGKVDKLGDAPPNNTLTFLRSQAVLLKKGEVQVDWGLTYSILDNRFAELAAATGATPAAVANIRERLQLMTIPFAVRYGVTDKLQAYVNVPLGWSNSETTSDQGDSVNNNFVGIGDVSAGFSYHFMNGCGAYVPDVIGTVGFVAPTGHATFDTSLLASNSVLGQGFWQITSNILAIHTIDPVVVYYGAGYVHRFEAEFGNDTVDAGQEFDYLWGVGFAINPWVTANGAVIGSYLTRYSVNDISIPGSDIAPIRFRISVTVVKEKQIYEPFAEIAMTQDSPSRVGIVFTY